MTPDQIQFIVQLGSFGMLSMFFWAMWKQMLRQADDCKKEIKANRDRIIDLHNRIAELEATTRIQKRREGLR